MLTSSVDRARLTLECFPTVSTLAEDTLNGKYSETHKPAIFSRTLVWKMVALRLNKVNRQRGHENVELNLANLTKLRGDYATLEAEFDVPWCRLNHDSEYYEPLALKSEGFDIAENFNKKKDIARMQVYHDPLSTAERTENESWHDNGVDDQDHLHLLESIITDVDRLFPEYPSYFIESLPRRKKMAEILFLWCRLNGASYFQGLHEICGLVYIVFQSESVNVASERRIRRKSLDKLDEQILVLLDEQFVAHDAFSVFNAMMKPILSKYYSESALLQQTIMFDLSLHHTDRFLYHLFKNKLRIDSRIWLMRYFRLLLIREIGLSQTMRLWDRLIVFSFLRDPFKADLDITLLLPYVILIMISAIKKRLIVADYGEALLVLLHYPVEKDDGIPPVVHNESIIFITGKKEEKDADGLLLPPTERREDKSSVSDLNFTYIEQNHQRRQRLSSSSSHGNRLSSSSHTSGHSSESSATSGDDSEDFVKLNIGKVVTDAIALYRMSDAQLETAGSKLLEKYSGMHNEEDRKGRISTASTRSTSPFFGDSVAGEFAKMTIQPSEMQPKPKKDFDRTRIEMRLQNRVKAALKK